MISLKKNDLQGFFLLLWYLEIYLFVPIPFLLLNMKGNREINEFT